MSESDLSESSMAQDPGRRRPPGALTTLLLAVLLVVPVQTIQATICIEQPGQVHHVRGVVVFHDLDSPWGIAGTLPGVVVHLERGKFEAQTVTDADGYFAFSHLPQGDYELSAELAGFLTTTGTVRVRRSAASGQVLIVDLPMLIGDCGGIAVDSWKVARKIQLQME